jgi:hypothetical protein
MKELSGIIENAHIYKGLLAAIEARPKAVVSLQMAIRSMARSCERFRLFHP